MRSAIVFGIDRATATAYHCEEDPDPPPDGIAMVLARVMRPGEEGPIIQLIMSGENATKLRNDLDFALRIPQSLKYGESIDVQIPQGW